MAVADPPYSRAALNAFLSTVARWTRAEVVARLKYRDTVTGLLIGLVKDQAADAARGEAVRCRLRR